MIALLGIIAVACVLSFVAQLVEAAVRALPLAKLEALEKSGHKAAGRLRQFRQDMTDPLAALLTLSTLANCVCGVILGAFLARRFSDATAVTVCFAAVYALATLLLAEFLPKALGVRFTGALAPRVVGLLDALIVVLWPFVRINRRLSASFEAAAQEKNQEVQAEMIALARRGVEEGSLLADEGLWVENALRLKHLKARDVMTPRTVVYRLPDELPLSLVTMHSEHWTHSRLPLCKDNDPDKVVGLVYRREVFDVMLEKEDEELEKMKLAELSHPVEFIPESLPAHLILQRFLSVRQHLFIVTNEHGGMEGVVTLEDVLEALLGREIVDHKDRHADMQEYARRLADMKRQGLRPPTGNPGAGM